MDMAQEGRGIPILGTKGPGKAAGFKKGDMLFSINGQRVEDVLDYMFYAADTRLQVEVLREGKVLSREIFKDEYEDLGLEFSSFLMDEKRRCANKCVFCFIDQMPPGMRPTLYFKDDDARLSFLQGNYITLTNLKDRDLERILAMRLNVNVSVHTTNPLLRVRMMGNPFAGEKLAYLYRLAGEGGVRVNCQIVLCPGLNDGLELERSLRDLSALPGVDSVAVVPVGLTKYRQGLAHLETVNREKALETLEIIEGVQGENLDKKGSRLVYAADEFYLLAERDFPEEAAYEGYPQYENGVGLLRSLINEFAEGLEDFKGKNLSRKISIACGTLVAPTINLCAKMAMEAISGLSVRVYPIVNDFFGHSITVTGLLTGGDLLNQLKGKALGEELLISSVMLKADEPIFLDDMAVSELSEGLGVPLRVSGREAAELLSAIMGK